MVYFASATELPTVNSYNLRERKVLSSGVLVLYKAMFINVFRERTSTDAVFRGNMISRKLFVL